MRKSFIFLFLVGVSIFLCFSSSLNCAENNAQPPSQQISNFSHLNFLNELHTFNNKEAFVTMIYCDFPYTKKAEARGEGVACIDDTARATVLYLRHYEYYKDDYSLDMARKGLAFVMWMQTDDGEFYNFIQSDLSKNRTGVTSYKSFSWWAARGIWALGNGYKVFSQVDKPFALEIEKSIQKSLNRFNVDLKNYGTYKTAKIGMMDVSLPKWLMGDSTDASATALLGLVDYYSATNSTDAANIITKLCDGIAKCQFGSFAEYPFCAYVDNINIPAWWHAWGAEPSYAMVKAGIVFKRKDWIESAKKEVDSMFMQIVILGPATEIKDGKVSMYPQIAYGVSPVVLAMLELYKATGDEKYARIAGLEASWFMGNNVIKLDMYDPKTGITYDGIDAPGRDFGYHQVNRNSGGESTIEALLALTEIEREPLVMKYLYYKCIDAPTMLRDKDNNIKWIQQLYVGPDGNEVVLEKDFENQKIDLSLNGDSLMKGEQTNIEKFYQLEYKK